MGRGDRCTLAVILSTVAILGSAAPGHSANTVRSRSDLPVCTAADLARWNEATDHSLGVEASDVGGNWIGSFPVYERDWFSSNDLVYFPYDALRKTLCGVMAEYTWHDEEFSDEADWNLNIVPDPHYAFLLDGIAARPSVSQIRPCTCPPGAPCTTGARVDCMQAEVTPDDNVYDNPWFPEGGGASLADAKRVCVHGPWVGDAGHGRRPEIHPAEIIWWSDSIEAGTVLTLLLVQEDSNRFDRRSWGEWYYQGAGDAPARWRPWSAVPRQPSVRLAFEAVAGSPASKLTVREVGSFRRNVVTADPPSLATDSDDGPDHALEVDGMIAVEVEALRSHSSSSSLSRPKLDGRRWPPCSACPPWRRGPCGSPPVAAPAPSSFPATA